MLEYNEETHTYTVDGRRVPSVTEIAGILTAGKYSDMNAAMLEQAKRRGTEVHELCEAIDCGIDPEELDIPPELVGYVNAYLAFLRDWRPEWDFIEKMVHTQTYAGRADRIGYIEDDLIILDIKTTANMDRLSRISLAVQLVLYGLAWLIMEGEAPVLLMGLQLKKNGKYTLHNVRAIESKDMHGEPVSALAAELRKICNVIGGYT